MNTEDAAPRMTPEERPEFFRLVHDPNYADLATDDVIRVAKRQVADRAAKVARRGTRESWGSIRARIYDRDGGGTGETRSAALTATPPIRALVATSGAA
jgi:hypothetical protein